MLATCSEMDRSAFLNSCKTQIVGFTRFGIPCTETEFWCVGFVATVKKCFALKSQIFFSFCFVVVFVQQMLLNAAKDVASALGALINATKNASGKSNSDPATEVLKTTGKVLYWCQHPPYLVY